MFSHFSFTLKLISKKFFIEVGDHDCSFFFFFNIYIIQLSQDNIWPFTFTEEFPHMSAQRISLNDSLWISFHVLWKWIMIGLERRKSSWVFRRWFPKLAICHSIFTHAMSSLPVFQVELVSGWLKFICFTLEFLNFNNQKQLRSCKHNQVVFEQNSWSYSESLLLKKCSPTNFLSEGSFLPCEIFLVQWNK